MSGRIGGLTLALATAIFASPLCGLAQQADPARGWLWTTSFYGYTYPTRDLPPDSTGLSPGRIRSQTFLLNNLFGYQANRYLAVTADVPVYFINFCQTDTSGVETCGDNNGLGDVGLSLRLSVGNPMVRLYSIGTLRLPTGDEAKGLGVGSTTGSWSNTLSARLTRTTPFVTVILANSLSQTSSFLRPFFSKGFVTELSGGLEEELLPVLYIGGSAYGVFPKGTQRTFGSLRRPQMPGAPPIPMRDPRAAPQQGETLGGEELTRDNGVSAWVRLPVHRHVQFLVSYTRSVRHDLDVVAYGIYLNFSPLLRR